MNIYKPSIRSQFIIVSLSILCALVFLVFLFASFHSGALNEKLLFLLLSIVFLCAFVLTIRTYIKFLYLKIFVGENFIIIKGLAREEKILKDKIREITIFSNKVNILFEDSSTMVIHSDYQNFDLLKDSLATFKVKNGIS